MTFKSRIVQLFVESKLNEEDPLDFGINPDTAPSTVIDTPAQTATKVAPAAPKTKTIDYLGQKIPVENPRNEKEVMAALDRQKTAIKNAVKKLFLEVFDQLPKKESHMRKFILNPLLRTKYTSKIEPVFRPNINYNDKISTEEKFAVYLQEIITDVYYKLVPRYTKAIDKAVDKENLAAIEKGIDPSADSIPQRHIDLTDRAFINGLLSEIWPHMIRNLKKRPNYSENYNLFRDLYREIRKKKFADLDADAGRVRYTSKDKLPSDAVSPSSSKKKKKKKKRR